MFRPLKALFAVAVFVASAGAWCATDPMDPPGRVARLNYVAGAVSFAPFESPDSWVQAVVNRPLTSGDRLWAADAGRAELHVGSTAIRLGALTSADILNLDDHTIQLRLAQGTLNLRVRDLPAGDVVEVATPSGAVLLRQPGSYRIGADPAGGYARVLVNFGQAEIVTPAQTFTVPSSQAATMTQGGPVQFEIAAYAAADEFDRWSADRDRREDTSPSARYVSRDMTGYEDLDQYGTWRNMPEYGAVWVPRVESGWAPFRHGHWAWVSPWGWTWVDDAPWGYAPSHYGRWVYMDNYWAWAPGPVARRPVYAPAVVAFVGGPSFSVSVHRGPAVGWFPLGWREPYIPWYRSSPAHVRNVNVTQVTNVTNITNVTNVRYVNRERPESVTVVPQQTFVSARPVAQSTVAVTRTELARAEVVRERPPAEPSRSSVAPERPGARPPAAVAAREVVSVNAPAGGTQRDATAWRDRPAFAPRTDDTQPRVRILRREREAPPASAPATAPAVAAPLTSPQLGRGSSPTSTAGSATPPMAPSPAPSAGSATLPTPASPASSARSATTQTAPSPAASAGSATPPTPSPALSAGSAAPPTAPSAARSANPAATRSAPSSVTSGGSTAAQEPGARVAAPSAPSTGASVTSSAPATAPTPPTRVAPPPSAATQAPASVPRGATADSARSAAPAAQTVVRTPDAERAAERRERRSEQREAAAERRVGAAPAGAAPAAAAPPRSDGPPPAQVYSTRPREPQQSRPQHPEGGRPNPEGSAKGPAPSPHREGGRQPAPAAGAPQ